MDQSSSLAAHFPTKRRIYSAPDANPADALLKQAQNDLKQAAEKAKQSVFRFDFSVNDNGAVAAATPKKKNKKKKKKKKKTNAVTTDEAPPSATKEKSSVKEMATNAATEGQPTANINDADLPPPAKDTKAKKTPSGPPLIKKTTAVKQPPLVLPSATVAATTPTTLAPPPGFLKLRKPASSDSEVIKMQLRYGRGKRNLSAIAQREKQKQQTASSSQESHDSHDTAGAAATPAFQFNFFS